MKKNLIILSIFCIGTLAACDPDRRTAQNEGYPDPDEVSEDLADFEPGLQEVNESVVVESAEEFIRTAYSGNLMEVELGRMAQEQATSAEVKELGKMLMEDHRAANDRLQTIAQSMNVEVPGASMPDMHQQRIEQLKGLSSKEFDQQYLTAILQAHENAIQRFEAAQNKFQDQALTQWISSTLETLRMHRNKIQQAREQLLS